MALNLSGWLERRSEDIGPHGDYIIKSVKEYEAEIADKTAALNALWVRTGDPDHWDPVVDEITRTALGRKNLT